MDKESITQVRQSHNTCEHSVQASKEWIEDPPFLQFPLKPSVHLQYLPHHHLSYRPLRLYLTLHFVSSPGQHSLVSKQPVWSRSSPAPKGLYECTNWQRVRTTTKCYTRLALGMGKTNTEHQLLLPVNQGYIHRITCQAYLNLHQPCS